MRMNLKSLQDRQKWEEMGFKLPDYSVEKMIENIVITGFDGILKTLPSLIIFGLVFKLLISVVSKGLVYFLLWKYKAELIQFILGSKARMVASDIGNKVEKGVTKTREVASQVPSRSLSSAQHLSGCRLHQCAAREEKVGDLSQHLNTVKDSLHFLKLFAEFL